MVVGCLQLIASCIAYSSRLHLCSGCTLYMYCCVLAYTSMAGGTLRASTPDLATVPQPVSWGELTKGDQHHLLVPVRLRARGQHPYTPDWDGCCLPPFGQTINSNTIGIKLKASYSTREHSDSINTPNKSGHQVRTMHMLEWESTYHCGLIGEQGAEPYMLNSKRTYTGIRNTIAWLKNI